MGQGATRRAAMTGLFSSSWCRWRWTPSSRDELLEAEQAILKMVKAPIEKREVALAPFDGSKGTSCSINTAVIGQQSPGRPAVVLLHGWGSGLGIFTLNLDALSQHYVVYALDMLGWGASTRKIDLAASTPEEAQLVKVNALEAWRHAVGLEEFTLLGHSLGTYWATSYTLEHPSRVRHLVLAAPVGHGAPDTRHPEWKKPRLAERAFNLIFWRNALACVRAMGPWGKGLVAKGRADTEGKQFPEEHHSVLYEYLYQLNAQEGSAGEAMFSKLMTADGWCLALYDRTHQVKVPVTCLFGEEDDVVPKFWADKTPGIFPAAQPLNVLVMPGGHQFFGDHPNVFVEHVWAAEQAAQRVRAGEGAAVVDAGAVEVAVP